MAFSVQMPALGESVTEGTVTRWLKREGEQVAVDEPLLEVSTDKVDTEIPSPAAGVLSRIVVGEDQTAEVGAELAVIDESGDGRTGAEEGAEQGGEPQAEARQEAEQDEQPERVPERQQAEEPQQAPEPEPEPAQAHRDEAAGQDGQAEQSESPRREQSQHAARSASQGAATPVTMPALGESVTEGTVTRWLKQVGDTVEVDEPLLEVSTDKVDTEIPSPVAGTLLEIKVGEDQTAEVGATLATVGSGEQTAGEPAPQPETARHAQAEPETPDTAVPERQAQPEREAVPSEQAEQQPGAQTAQAPTAPPAHPEPQADGHPDGAPYVTPLVRKLAAEHDVDLSDIKGTGVGGRIRKQDVLAAAEAAKAPPAAPRRPPPRPSASRSARCAARRRRCRGCGS
jgi:pyruvate dehydrogenase E2 component (dihydrolipoamide acetyltransferase)